MEFVQTYTVLMPRHSLWLTLMDVHKVASCLTGVEDLQVLADDNYTGRMSVKMGPVRLRFAGNVKVALRDYENHIGILEAQANDSKAGGGFKAALEMKLMDEATDATCLALNLQTTFLGRIGELGRPLIKKKINTMMDDFVAALTEKYTGNPNV